MNLPQYRYLFGPVPSRRFGRSLGIDLTPLKTCSLDCIFCQLGRTIKKTLIRDAYVPTAEVIKEIEQWLKSGVVADYLTLSGSGEPTLHAQFGQVLAFLRNHPIPSVLLTNGTLFHLPEVREAASQARVVKVSLSAWDQHSFEWVNRPHRGLDFMTMLDGLRDFRKGFDGQLWLEVFLLSGINAMPKDVEKIARLAHDLKPDRIHLNTIARPPAEDFAAAVPMAQLEQLSGLFEPPARIATGFSTHRTPKTIADESSILAMLERRPCTINQITAAFGMHINEVSKILGHLMRSNQIRADLRNTEVYYTSLSIGRHPVQGPVIGPKKG
jgi:wyosine [tRNA(Phe)-imidazoG37] synthetase (radical SAM superfamily)